MASIVVGLGKTGASCLRYFAKHGIAAAATDSRLVCAHSASSWWLGSSRTAPAKRTTANPAALGSLSGSLYAFNFHFLSPEMVATPRSFELIAMLVLTLAGVSDGK